MDTSYAPAYVFKPKSCAQQAIERLLPALEIAYGNCLRSVREELDSAYRSACASPENIHDVFRYSFSTSYHHYTLYYYDRIGNLIKTVPPKGVNLTGANTRTRLDHPAHTMATEYEYNSLKQLVRQSTPDGGETKFWYNATGQLRLSQDARQAALSPMKYSYTKYDDLGRIVEVGETGIGMISPQSFADNASLPTSGQTETTTTVYTTAASGVTYQPGSKPQRYLQNRVSYTYTADGVYTYYSYDPHGNVEWVIQELPGLGKSTARYDYDLISGKVLGLVYQEQKSDRLHLRYKYDDDSRLIESETSRNGWLWEREARYSYYGHGPLRRLELGHDRIQGLDYVYTIHGWLKGINHPALDLEPTYDPGGDGTGSSVVAADAYGMILGYYSGDFDRKYSGESPYNNAGTYYLSGTDLYNGNISTWTNHIQASGQPGLQDEVLTGNRYRYDLLNRLKDDKYYKKDGEEWVNTDNYNSDYEYDPNGNIRHLNRYAGSYGQIDDLDYNYEQPTLTNRLSYLKDNGALTGVYTGDIDHQPSPNYAYDASGNLIKDSSEGIATGAIKWTVYGKVQEVTETDSTRMKYYYDASGNRVKKEKYVYSGGSYVLSKVTWYVYEAGGTVLGVYEKNYSGDTAVVLKEMPLYGSARIGMLLPGVKRYSSTPDTVGIFSRYVDRRIYELTDHLGNIRAIVGDVKLPSSGLYVADLKGYSNYYPFGMLQPERHWSSEGYRYGYNGKEKDNEIKGEGTSYDYGARIYDARVGRWMSRDPMEAKYVDLSPYSYSRNNAILFIDPDGRKIRIHYVEGGRNKYYDYTPGVKPTISNTFVQQVHEAASFAMKCDATNTWQQLGSEIATVDIRMPNNDQERADGASARPLITGIPSIDSDGEVRHDANGNVILESVESVSSEIIWQPDQALKTQNGQGAMSPSTILFHEVGHSLRQLRIRSVADYENYINDSHNDPALGEFDNREEKRVILHSETYYINSVNMFGVLQNTNPMLSPQIQATRRDHRGELYPVQGGVNSITPADGSSIPGQAGPSDIRRQMTIPADKTKVQIRTVP